MAQGFERFEHAGAGGIGLERRDGIQFGEAVGQACEPDRKRRAALFKTLAGVEQRGKPGWQRAEFLVCQPLQVRHALRNALPPQREFESEHLILACGELAQHEGRFQQVEQLDVREIARHAFQPAVDHRGGGGGRQRPAGFVGHQHVHAFEQRAHPARGFAVERDECDGASAGVQLGCHPGGDGARFGFQVRRRGERDPGLDRRVGEAPGQGGGTRAQRRFGQLPGLLQGQGHAVFQARLEQRERYVLGTAREKLLLDGRERAQRIAIDRLCRRPDVFGQRVECARIAGLRIAAVAVERLPHRLDQRRFAVEHAGMQRANPGANRPAQPRGGEFVGQLQQFIGERPLVDFAKPDLMTQYAMQSRQASRQRFAAVVGHACARKGAFGPGFQRGDAWRNQDREAGALCQYTGKILPGTVVGDEHRQPGQIGQAVGVLVEQKAGGGVRQRRAARDFQGVQRSRCLILSLTPAHSSASGSGSFFSMMTFHCLASSAFNAM